MLVLLAVITSHGSVLYMLIKGLTGQVVQTRSKETMP